MKKIIISTMLLLVGLMSAAANDIVSLKFNRTGTDAASVAVSVVDGEGNAIEGASASLTSVSHGLKTGGSITSGIVCPNINGNTNPTITMTFTVAGLPEGYTFDKLGLHIHALNGGGNYQETSDGVVRQWNVSAAAGDNAFASFENIDIAAGIPGSNKLWETNQFNSVGLDANGNLVLTLTITKGTTNTGCFFGLSEVRLVTLPELVHTFSADKVYYIRPQKAGATYLTEAEGKLSMANNDLTKYQFWRLIPTDKSHCYYIQNVVTKKYIAACNENATNNTQAATGTEPVEYYIGITASTINEIAGCYYMASTNWPNYDTEAQGPKCLNTGGSVGGAVVTYTAGPNGSGGYKKNSYWRFEETTDEYQRPAPPAHADASKALTVYFRPCGTKGSTYLTAATVNGVDPIAYTAAAQPSGYHVPYSKDRGAVVRGGSFDVNITLNNSNDADLKANAYFDWNADGDFEVTEAITLNGTTGSASVTVPEDAVSGDTRMRIRVNSNGLDYADDDVEGFVYDFNLSVVDATTERKVYLDVNGERNGTVALSATGDSHAVGTQLTATATPKGNATFESWREGGVVVSRDAEYTFTVEDRNMTLKAYFTPNTEPEGTPAQWDFTFNRTSESEATVAVTRDGVAVEGVTATIAIAPTTNYLTSGKLAGTNGDGYANGTGILCINKNTNEATKDTPHKYTLTVNNTTDEAFAFSYVEIYGVGVTGGGEWQSAYAPRQRYFKVKHGDTTLEPRIVSINDASHCNGTETVNGFNADMVVPAGGTYTIELDLYGGGDITGDFALGCYYGLTKIALGAVPHYAVTVEGTEEAEAGVTYGNTTYKDGSTLNATLSLAQSELAAAPVEGYLGSVALDKALGTILVTYQPCITTQWDITFNRTSNTEATASVTRGGEAVEGVTATIAIAGGDYQNQNQTANNKGILCINRNTTEATEADPNKYTLTITNNTDKICLFDYIEVSDVALNGSGQYQGNTVTRVRNFKVTYGGTTIGPEEREICNPAHSEGKEYPQGFGAKVSIPAKGTYTIVLEIYKIDHNNTAINDIGTGCFYGLSKIALGNTTVSFGTTGYATLYAPIALTIPGGVTAYTGTLNEDWLTLKRIESNTIPKEHAVILKGETGTKYTLEAATSAGTTVSNNDLKGQTSTIDLEDVNVGDNEAYTLQPNGEGGVVFKRFDGDYLSGGKAYLMLSKSSAQSIGIRFEGTTDIEHSTLTPEPSTQIYDLMGRRVEAITKGGIYIVNGKKVIK